MASLDETIELTPYNCVNLPKIQNNEIQHIDYNQLSYNEFYWNNMKANWPVIITNVSNNWECRQHWIEQKPYETNAAVATDYQHKQQTSINFNYLKEKFPNWNVPVYNCHKSYYNNHEKQLTPLYDFLEYWQKKIIDEGELQIEKNTCTSTEQITAKEDVLYLKDWHLQAQFADYDFYKVPKHFASDWLNEYLVMNQNDDYRFVYMGPKNSWTPFHADVFGSYSWSTNIVGVKQWYLLPMGEETKLLDNLNNLPSFIDEFLLRQHDVTYYTVLQQENEALFVPSGWYHQVTNITDTISINHNWFNACNITQIWNNLITNLANVVNEISDCRQMDNFDEHCQKMLRANFGINYLDFIQLIEFITERRLQNINIFNGNNTEEINSLHNLQYLDRFTYNNYHIVSDIMSIKKLLMEILQNSAICNNHQTIYQRCKRLQQLLETAIT